MIDPRFYDLTAHLWRGSRNAYYWTPNDGDGKRYSYWLTVGAGAPTVPKMFHGLDCYFGVHGSRIRRSQYERARIKDGDIEAINCLYFEMDCKTSAAKADALDWLQAWYLKPSVVVDSGGGYHVYLLLEDSFLLDSPAAQQRAIELQWAMVKLAGGDTQVNDLSRVLRVPGTSNHKAEYAPNYPLVSIIQWDMAHRYLVSDLEPFLQPTIDARNSAKAHTPNGANHGASAVSLSESELLEALFRAKNGRQYEALFNGDLSSVNNDHSVGDQTLCNGFAWVANRDLAVMDQLFRRSALMRPKWNTKGYRERTLQNAAHSAQTVYTPSAVNPAAQAAANGAIGSQPKQAGGAAAQPGNPQGGYKPPSNPLTADYITALHSLGYYFKLNVLDDHIEVNDRRLDDFIIKTIRNKMRDLGFKRGQIMDMEEAYWEDAYNHSYHPIKDYLQSLRWDGDDHIRLLARHFQDKHGPIIYANGSSEPVFYVWLKRWLIAAVAKVYSGNTVNAQNPVLVIEGGQNLGKSTFARWLCSGIPRYFIEKSIDPDSKEDERRLASNWIWEVGELGATTRKADREALKSFITKEKCKFRNPYAREDSEKYALASFIGTVNNEGGFLQDATGSRRFNTVGLTAIVHEYITTIDVNQVWAQAYELFRANEPWRLLPEEDLQREELNSDYKTEDAYEGWIRRYFEIDLARADAVTPGWFTSTQEIVNKLKIEGVTGDTRAVTMYLAATMKEIGLEKSRYPKRDGIRGYWGVKVKP